jgi:hypothetical protein
MAMVVQSRLARRVERRTYDYQLTLVYGTAPAVGRSEPPLPNRLTELLRAGAKAPDDEFRAMDAVLDQIWKADEGNWQRRLEPFLNRLDKDGSRRFAGLVKLGCQPDQLAEYFDSATARTRASRDTRHLRSEITQLLKLTDTALAALQTLSKRRTEFDVETAAKKYRVLESEPGTAELNILVLDFEDFVRRDSFELRHYLGQLDGRRQLLLTDPKMKLSNRIRDITGTYHDTDFETILDCLLASQGRRGRNIGTLKNHRARWKSRMRGE